MPFKSDWKIRLCKYCNKLAKENICWIKRRRKWYYKTCGSKECLRKQYDDVSVNQKKAYLSRNVQSLCKHCKINFTKNQHNNIWCKKCVPNNASREIMKRYNLNNDEYKSLVKLAWNKCCICMKNKPSVVDHCHITNKVRWFICQWCNMALHLVENKIALLRAFKYLNQ